ncbi:hypothetical protein [Aminobacter carboxidus]|uniref:DUF4224 domain-containing protein n=1 Tax=Aminobacter carboxidus TaxID=376165 RepID=A0ABR9GQI3_9HYPH|nr:hypothetical protein [Aminobacter carboxidus]MBE1205947.1 hypothetical protein [Aminobacter carboxidus]
MTFARKYDVSRAEAAAIIKRYGPSRSKLDAEGFPTLIGSGNKGAVPVKPILKVMALRGEESFGTRQL